VGASACAPPGPPFQAWLSEVDREYNELIRRILSSELAPDSNCVDIGSFEGDFLAG
jgi:hypothetical protein